MMSINIDIADLRAVTAVAAYGSFRQAAESLHISQPTLSVRIRNLEARLGGRLFRRTTRRIETTDMGETFIQNAPRILADLDLFLARIERERLILHGSVTIGVTPTVAAGLLPVGLVKCRENWPDLDVQIVDDGFMRILGALRNKLIDFAILQIDKVGNEFRIDRIGSEVIVAVMRSDHKLAGSRRVSMLDLSPYPILISASGSNAWRAMEEALALSGAKFRPVFQAHSFMTLISMVREGAGVMRMPSSMLRLLNLEDLSYAVISDLKPRQIGIVSVQDRPLRSSVREVMTFFKSEIREQLRSSAA